MLLILNEREHYEISQVLKYNNSEVVRGFRGELALNFTLPRQLTTVALKIQFQDCFRPEEKTCRAARLLSTFPSETTKPRDPRQEKT